MAESEIRHSMESDDDDNDDDAWAETEMEQMPAKCLFCPDNFESPDAVFAHCKSHHQFDIHAVARLWDLECIGYIKMVNYIRFQKPDPKSLCEKVSSKAPWDSDDFMKPHNPEDEMLQFDIEDLTDMPDVGESECAMLGMGEGAERGQPDQYHVMVRRLAAAEDRCRQGEEALQRLLGDMENIKLASQQLVMSQPSTQPSQQNGLHASSQEQDGMEEAEDPYFSSYGHFSIHEEMLKDRVRTESYRDFMYRNKNLLQDKVVLDVGCGTGILSMFAARAGAKHVYAVDMAEIIYQAMDIAGENQLSDKITFIKGKLEDITLPCEKVDIIISEWMGYFLLFESMLDSVLYARAKYLKPDGAVYPDRCNVSLCAMSDIDLYNKHVTYWEDVYGFKMTCMKSCVVREASVAIVDKDKVISDSSVLKVIDVCSCDLDDLQFTSKFELTIHGDGPITAIVGYFDIVFQKNCENLVSFSTGPDSTPTHWKQSVFLLDTPMDVKKGDVLRGELSCRKNRKDPRSLIIDLTFNDKHLIYHME